MEELAEKKEVLIYRLWKINEIWRKKWTQWKKRSIQEKKKDL